MTGRTLTSRVAALFVATALGWAHSPAGAEEAPEAARRILEATGVRGGLVVHVGCGDGKLTAALRTSDSFLVHGLDTDAANVERARAHVRSLGLYGPVSVDRLTGSRLPYIDNLVALVVSDDLAGVPAAEVRRVLAPNGVAYIRQGGRWTKTVKPRPQEIDEWTHYMHDASNNAVAHDTVVGPPRRLQWVGSPRWSRHHDRIASMSALVSSGGRIFYIFDMGPTASVLLPPRRVLIARDAFSGVVLWRRSVPTWFAHLWPFKSGPAQLPRRLIAIGNRVYVTLGLAAPLSALDAATGRIVRTYDNTLATEEVIAHGGTLFLLVNPAGAPPRIFRPVNRNVGRAKARVARGWAWDQKPRQVVAVEPDTGKVLWRKQQKVMPLTLAADARGVYCHDGQKLVSLDRKTGAVRWSSAPVKRRSPVPPGFAPTLVVHGDVVLFAGGDRSMTAVSADTGKTLWTERHHRGGHNSPEDLLVVRGLVWSGAIAGGRDSGVFTGRDLKTGVVKSEFRPNVRTYWFHHRCYRSKATDRYILPSRTGTEFVDVERKTWEIHHWVRGGCMYGIMPCNGLIYAAPSSCACYPEAKLVGFNALAPAASGKPEPPLPDDRRLERGPAYGKIGGRQAAANEADWPTYRHDPARSGRTKTAVPAKLKVAWTVKLGGRLTSPVVADGKVFLASVDTHTVHALDAADGRGVWRFTAGGRVDGPPTIHNGSVLFGSADGWVYCLRAADGKLAWRFQAAPHDRRTVAFEQVESVWPVPGNVMVLNDVAHCVAGRSMFLDGGLRLLRLDAKTGRKLSETVMNDRDPTTGKNLQVRVKILNMPVALPDVLSSDGRHIYMRSQQFSLKGVRERIGPHSGVPAQQGSAQHGEGVHLFSPGGFADGTWFHRSYWVYGRSFAGGHSGYWQAGRFAPSGRILAFDDKAVYGYGRRPEYYKWTTPLRYQLFASKKAPAATPAPPDKAPPADKAGESQIFVANSPSLNPARKPLTVAAWIKSERPNGVILARGGRALGYVLMLKGGAPRFAIRSNGKLRGVTAKDKVGAGWTHIAGVLTRDRRILVYVNGKLSASAKVPWLIASDPRDGTDIGTDGGSPVGAYKASPAFKGLMDEVRIYRRALTAKQVQKHAQGVGKVAAKPVLYYSFDKGDATDDSGNRNRGTVGSKPVDGKFGKAMQFSGNPTKRVMKGVAGATGRVKYQWTRGTPLHVRAMVLAGNTLFLAGPPTTLNEEKAFDSYLDAQTQAALAGERDAFAGRRGALLLAVSAADGAKLAERKLASMPIFDGMAAARGRLYLSTTDGRVLCLGAE